MRRTIRRRGSNQYQSNFKTLKSKTFRDVVYVSSCIFVITTIGWHYAHTDHKIISPIPQAHAQLLVQPFFDKYGVRPPTPKEKKTPDLAAPDANWNTFVQNARVIAPLYGYPVNVLLSQAALESNRGQSDYARTRNNYFGINAVDWNPDDASTYHDQVECIIAYIELIKRNFPEAWAARSDSGQLVNLLEQNSLGMMYATDPDYVWKLQQLPEWSEQ